jgi:hypothetical protein
MDQIETFRGFVVPKMPDERTQREHFCQDGVYCNTNCHECLFDYDRPETLEPFKQWLEERKK